VGKVFNAWELRSWYPSLCPQSILFKRLTGKVFWNKELASAPLFFSAPGLVVVLTVPVCASYCLGKGYASHHDDFAVENRTPSAFPHGRVLRLVQKKPPMAAVPTSAQFSLAVWYAVWSLRLSAGLRNLCQRARPSLLGVRLGRDGCWGRPTSTCIVRYRRWSW
jgi:hypothetical protein